MEDVAHDDNKLPIAPKMSTSERGCSGYICVGPKETLNTWAKFSAPPERVKTISVYIPRVEPFENVPITK